MNTGGEKPEQAQDTAVNLADRRVLVLVPAFNEERLIGSLLLRLKQLPVEILVVDDGSEDRTAQIAQAAGVKCLSLAKNQGKAAALNLGMQAARETQPDAVVLIDADGQHLPEELPVLVAPVLAGEADICIGSRYLEDRSNTPSGRRIGHKLINLATSLPSGMSSSDSQSGYRALSKHAYEAMTFQSSGFTVESEMQFIAAEHKLRVVEVPITIRYLDKAKRPAIQQGASVLNGILRLTGQYRPLLYFGATGLVLVVGGVVMGLVVIDRYIQLQQLAVGYAMITVLLGIAGLLLLTTGVTLHSVRSLLNDMLGTRLRNGKGD